MSGNYSQKPLGHTKKSATDALKTFSKRAIQKTTEATSDLIGNTIANKTRKVSRSSQQNNSKTIRNEHNKEIPKERYMSAEQRQKIVDDSSLI